MKKLAVAALVGLAFVGNALAGDTVRYGSFYELNQEGSCGSGFCRLNFSSAPADKFFRVKRVNCVVRVKTSIAFAYIGNLASNGNAYQRLWDLEIKQRYGYEDPYYFYSINTEIDFQIGKLTKPTIFVQVPGTDIGGIRCVLTGELV